MNSHPTWCINRRILKFDYHSWLAKMRDLKVGSLASLTEVVECAPITCMSAMHHHLPNYTSLAREDHVRRFAEREGFKDSPLFSPSSSEWSAVWVCLGFTGSSQNMWTHDATSRSAQKFHGLIANQMLVKITYQGKSKCGSLRKLICRAALKGAPSKLSP